ncbi:MAG: putative antitoxin of bacterial toxin-antitoxin system, YdaS/YdaT [Caulobacter sp.]|nr:putative antitoxin of bacterial toxin-antitoxin system, YdaS/YdaT [Caulobacter sp.]
MDIAALRLELKLTQQAFGQLIGLSSKGHVSQLERGELPCSIDVALMIERLSGGRIPADDLNSDVARVRRATRELVAA